MMKRILLVLGLILHLSTSQAQNPIPVIDMMLKDSIAENIRRNIEQFGLLELIRDQTETIRDSVEATRELQYGYQTFLRQTASTRTLAFMDGEVAEEAIGQGMSMAHHLDDYSFAANLHEIYQQQAEPMHKSQALYDVLAPYDETLIFPGLASFQQDQTARQLNRTALHEMSRRRKLQLANAYRNLAEQKIEAAAELRTLLTTDERFSMTEAERLETLGRMQDYLLESQRLNARADQIIQRISQPSFSKKQVLTSFQKQQERALLSQTPLF